MDTNASIHIPEWAADVWDRYVPSQWPWFHRTIEKEDWDRWGSTMECQGFWKTLDPFPPRIALSWEKLMITNAPRLYRNTNFALHSKLLEGWEKDFVSALIRLQINTHPSLNFRLQPEGEVHSSGHFVGRGLIATVQQWQPATCGHQSHPQGSCEASTRALAPVTPKLNMNYWFAHVQDGDYCFDAVLEAPLRVDLGSRGNVWVCRAQQILEWFLPRAARKLDRYSPELPSIIANSQIEDLFFRASRTHR